MKRHIYAVLALAMFLLTACGDKSTMSHTLSITPDAFSASVVAGANVELHGSVSSSTQGSLYSGLGNLPSDVHISDGRLGDMDGQSQPFSLIVSVPSDEAAGTYNGYVEFHTDTSEHVRVPFQLTVTDTGFVVEQDPSNPVSVYASESANVPVTVKSINGFSGQVTLQLSGLPSGVTQSAPVTVNLHGNDTAINVPIAASASAGIHDANVVITGQSAGQSSQITVVVKSRPPRVQIPGSSSSVYGPVIDANGVIYVESDTGIYKTGANLRITKLSSSVLQCGLSLGQDGGLWGNVEPFVRMDLATGQTKEYPSPRHISGCAFSYPIDKKSRVWILDRGLQRLDLINQTAAVVTGTENIGTGPVVLDGSAVWTATDNNLYKADGDSLALARFSVPGVDIIGGFAVSNHLIYFAAKNQIASFDPTTQTVSFLAVANFQVRGIIGLDGQGALWLRAYQAASPYALMWIRVALSSRQVLREVPDLGGGFGNGPAVAPDGGLFYTEGMYLLHVAP